MNKARGTCASTAFPVSISHVRHQPFRKYDSAKLFCNMMQNMKLHSCCYSRKLLTYSAAATEDNRNILQCIKSHDKAV